MTRASQLLDGRTPFEISVRSLAKSYAGVTVLHGVDLQMTGGAIHALVGENGAGKSTLVRILSGATPADAGEITIDGTLVELGSPRRARELGISMVSQELNLLPLRSVEDNVLIGQTPASFAGLVSRRRAAALLAELEAQAGMHVRDVDKVDDLGPVEKTYVEILRAMAGRLRALILDEPTTAMGREDSDKVLRLARKLADRGICVVLVSHALSDVLNFADTITVLRDGEVVRTAPRSDYDESSLIKDMIGRTLGDYMPTRPDVTEDAPFAFEAQGVVRAGTSAPVSFAVRKGEILGIGGLAGSGRSELVCTLVGAIGMRSGGLRVDGGDVRVTSVAAARSHGVVMVPESRKEQGLHLDKSSEWNIALPSLGRLGRLGFLSRRRQRALAATMLDVVGVRASAIDEPVRSLSGGNQQRVLFARWLATNPSVLIVDEPTRGVDIAGKRAIYELIMKLAEQGVAVIVVSSELTELIGLSHRVLVMSANKVVAELSGVDATENAITTAAFHSDILEEVTA